MKIKTLFIGIAILLNMATTFAQSGFCGLSAKWVIKNDTLTISGSGEIYNYDVPDGGPWGNYKFSTAIIENGITSIGNFAFFHIYYLASIHIANTVTKIGRDAFALCPNITFLNIPNSVTYIDENAFTSPKNFTGLDYKLVSIILPSKLNYMGESVFAGSENLTSITNLNPVPLDINPNVFEDVNVKACILKVPAGSVKAYKRAPVWKEFNIVGITVDIDEYENGRGEEQLLIYPNPNTGTCRIIIPEEFQNERFLTLSIYNNSGKMVQEISIDNENPEYNLKLDSKATGVYVAVLSNGKRSVRGRIVFN